MVLMILSPPVLNLKLLKNGRNIKIFVVNIILGDYQPQISLIIRAYHQDYQVPKHLCITLFIRVSIS